jgi:hypothetical protein
VEEVYISTDVETDGPIPGPNSMLSLGSAAFSEGGTMRGTFSANFQTLPGAAPDQDTQKWWESQSKDVYEACRSNPEDPKQVMLRYANWLENMKDKGRSPVFVGYPAGFDFLFTYWYLMKFAGFSPFSFSAIDIKTFVMAELGSNYRESTKRNMPKRWFKGLPPHTHRALDDAIEQGQLFMNILRENRARHANKSL